ncbi:MAG: ATP-dependent DNA ligase [Candidatus Diapherotrites archaeon]|uniref:DNA ligase n=1 Tax=Candidatus Iainarchaeum sp. TaxID=3101447 RepID=A0A8T3YKQ5_9ARCH|nr:ATP-dependent DNA ligase [Candidatus Diapherotrites archaeon]
MLFSELAAYFDSIENISSRLEMSTILAEMLSKAEEKEIGMVIYLSQGALGPRHKALEVGIGEGLLEQGIAKATGYTKDEVAKLYKQMGDLGLVAEKLVEGRKQGSLFSEKLTIAKVFGNFVKIAQAGGKGSQDSKLGMFAELLNSASKVEARYIARVPLGNLRLGVGDPTLMDALALNYLDEFTENKKTRKAIEKGLKEKNEEKRKEEFRLRARQGLREVIEAKYNIFSDLGAIAEKLKAKGLRGLDEIDMMPGAPIRPTLAERLPSAEEIVKKLGKCAVETKYDGFRLAMHKNGNEVTIFSRQSENMTEMFPDLVEAVRKQIKARKAIFEGEALAYSEETQQYFPFQVTIQRKRKYDIAKKAEEFPLRLFAFDIMYLDGKNLMARPFRERRQILGKIIGKGEAIALTKSIETDSPEKINQFFLESIESGLEGIIAKDLNSPYIAGARKFAWIKLKRSYKGELSDSVDVTIIGYFKGRGKRTQFGLGGLLTAVYDRESDTFKSVAKIGTGMSEEMLSELESKLSKTSVKQRPSRVDSEIEPHIWVEPLYVIEVRADEITRSPMHTAGRDKGGTGYALRFPRMIKFREKRPEESTTVEEIIAMYRKQPSVQVEGTVAES